MLVCSAEESVLMCAYGAAERTGGLGSLWSYVCYTCVYKYTQLFNYEADAFSVKIWEDLSKSVMKFCCDVTKLKLDRGNEIIAACMVQLPAGCLSLTDASNSVVDVHDERQLEDREHDGLLIVRSQTVAARPVLSQQQLRLRPPLLVLVKGASLRACR